MKHKYVFLGLLALAPIACVNDGEPPFSGVQNPSALKLDSTGNNPVFSETGLDSLESHADWTYYPTRETMTSTSR